MTRSMTGFGVATGGVGNRRVTVDVRSVNHRFLTSTIRLSGELSRFEYEVRDLVKKRVTRGHVSLSARFEDGAAARPSFDEASIAGWVQVLRGIKERHALAGDVDLGTILRLPDLFGGQAAVTDEDGKALIELCERALVELAASRAAEGATLARYLIERLERVEHALGRIAIRAPERVTAHRERLRAAVEELAGGVQVDPQRLAVEVAMLAERLDVGEEVERFTAHIGAFRDTVGSGADGVGKRLGFLLQEMLREANTTGSKSNDIAMTADVVLIKEELERLREQVENIE